MSTQPVSERTRSLSEKFKRQIIEKLREESALCQERIERAKINIATPDDGSAKNGDTHVDASPSEPTEVSIAVMAGSTRTIARITVALRRIEEGTYGVCKENGCGRDITENRLLALPHASRCIDCANKDEQKRLRPRPGTQVTRAGSVGTYPRI